MFWIILGTFTVSFSPWLDHIAEVFVFVYFPTIKMVELRGHYVGGSNDLLPKNLTKIK